MRGFFIFAAVSFTLTIAFVFWMMRLDLVEESYATKINAKEADLFKRGWLPRIIPDSATNIQLVNNLDINTSEGQFDFAPMDADGFIRSIVNGTYSNKKLGENDRVKELKKLGYTDYHYDRQSYVWRFLIHQDTGRCEYWYVNVR